MKSTLRIVIGSLIAASFAATFSVMASPGSGSGKALLQAKTKQKEVEDDEKDHKVVKPTKPSSKLSPVDAMKIAESKSGGRAKLAMFEFDEGAWIYGVVVVKNHKLLEVEVDANSGKVLETENVTPDGEAKEFKNELAKLAKTG